MQTNVIANLVGCGGEGDEQVVQGLSVAGRVPRAVYHGNGGNRPRLRIDRDMQPSGVPVHDPAVFLQDLSEDAAGDEPCVVQMNIAVALNLIVLRHPYL